MGSKYYQNEERSKTNPLVYTLGARGSSTLIGGIMRDARGFKLGGGEREEPLELTLPQSLTLLLTQRTMGMPRGVLLGTVESCVEKLAE